MLKIRLYEIEPEIWRRFVVPAEITLDRLHDVIQIVMGWKDHHFHEFVIGKNRYTENPRSKEDGKPGGMFRLVDLIKQKGRAFSYVYDFGDQWEHEIILEDNRYFNSALFKIVEFLNLVIMISADIIHSNQWRCRHVMQSFQQTQGR